MRRSLDLSCLDDIPEERELSGKSSEEKEITRVDSGLGEWDSESSRKTSFSSQGRLSPDFGTEKTSKVRFVRKASQVFFLLRYILIIRSVWTSVIVTAERTTTTSPFLADGAAVST